MKGFFAIIAMAAAASATYIPSNSTISTVTAVVTDTITQCASTVSNCPARSIITTVYQTTYTTICPITASAKPTPSAAPSVPNASFPPSAPNTPVAPSTKPIFTSAPVYPTTVTPVAPTTNMPMGTASASTGLPVSKTTTPSAPISTGSANKMGAAFGVVVAAAAVMAL